MYRPVLQSVGGEVARVYDIVFYRKACFDHRSLGQLNHLVVAIFQMLLLTNKAVKGKETAILVLAL